MDYEITAVEAIDARPAEVALALGGIKVCGSPAGVSARVEIVRDGEATRLGVSRLEGEEEWIVDSMALANGAVAFANGVGARYCKLRTIKDRGIVAALDAAAEAVAA